MRIIYYIFLIFISASLPGCKGKTKDSIVKADSANKAKLDTALNHNQVVVDEKSSAFLVRISDEVKAEMQITGTARHVTISQIVKEFAATVYLELATINDSINNLAIRKNVVLPGAISKEGMQDINSFQKSRGSDADKLYMNYIIKNHESIIPDFEKAMLDTKDQDVRSFADISLMLFKKYLNTAKAIQSKL